MSLASVRIALVLLLGAAVLVEPAAAQQARHVLGSEHMRVLHWPEDVELAELARTSGDRALARLERMLDIDLDERIDVYIVRSQQEFDELTGMRNSPWIIGRAMSRLRRVVIKPMGTQRLPTLLAHELAHIMLDLRMGEEAHTLPRWLHEGLAKYASDDFDEADRRIIAQAAVADELLTIDELDAAFLGDSEQMMLAYAQSYTLVRHLGDLRPAEGISPVLDQLERGRDVRLALGLAYQRPVPQMESEWLEQLRSGYIEHIAPPLAETLIGALVVIAFLIALLLSRRRSARIRERMEREERLRAEFGVLPTGPYTLIDSAEPSGAEEADRTIIE